MQLLALLLLLLSLFEIAGRASAQTRHSPSYTFRVRLNDFYGCIFSYSHFCCCFCFNWTAICYWKVLTSFTLCVENSVHYGTERWNALTMTTMTTTGALVCRSDRARPLTGKRDGGLTYHIKSNRLFWIIDKLSLWALHWIFGDIANCKTKCVCRCVCIVCVRLWFQAIQPQTQIPNCDVAVHT